MTPVGGGEGGGALAVGTVVASLRAWPWPGKASRHGTLRLLSSAAVPVRALPRTASARIGEPETTLTDSLGTIPACELSIDTNGETFDSLSDCECLASSVACKRDIDRISTKLSKQQFLFSQQRPDE